jgi:hypothetical protein
MIARQRLLQRRRRALLARIGGQRTRLAVDIEPFRLPAQVFGVACSLGSMVRRNANLLIVPATVAAFVLSRSSPVRSAQCASPSAAGAGG